MGCCQFRDEESAGNNSKPKINDDFELIGAIVSQNLEEVRSILTANQNINQPISTFNYKTPLHIAAENGSNNVVTLLLSLGADPNIKDRSGATPIFLAAYNNHKKCIQLLTKGGAKINIRTNSGLSLKDYVPNDKVQQIKKIKKTS